MKVSRELKAKLLKLAGVDPARARKAVWAMSASPDVAPVPQYTLSWFLEGLGIASTPNRREHWAVIHTRHKAQAAAVENALRTIGLYGTGWQLPGSFKVELVRCYTGAGKPMDSDNLGTGFKAVRDALAQWLDINDGNENAATWHYAQDRGTQRGIRIIITGGMPITPTEAV